MTKQCINTSKGISKSTDQSIDNYLNQTSLCLYKAHLFSCLRALRCIAMLKSPERDHWTNSGTFVLKVKQYPMNQISCVLIVQFEQYTACTTEIDYHMNNLLQQCDNGTIHRMAFKEWLPLDINIRNGTDTSNDVKNMFGLSMCPHVTFCKVNPQATATVFFCITRTIGRMHALKHITIFIDNALMNHQLYHMVNHFINTKIIMLLLYGCQEVIFLCNSWVTEDIPTHG